MKDASLWRARVSDWIKRQKRLSALLQTDLPLDEKFPDFPSIFQHCGGYNSTLGPSECHIGNIINYIVAQQQPFFNRLEGAITGLHLSADHHHNAPGRMQVTDRFNGQKFAPIEGLHAVMTERQQVASHQFTATTNNAERKAVANGLLQRYEDREIDHSNLVMYLDKCCDDKEWLNVFQNITVLLDNHHLITRYRDNSNGTDGARHANFMGDIARIIVGVNQAKMRAGPVIYNELSEYITKVKTYEVQQNVPSGNRIITNKLLSCHDTQKKHFDNCITPPEAAATTVLDRFFRSTLCRGSGKNENLWRHVRAAFPEKIGLDSGVYLMLSITTNWNFNRELQFDPRWAYIPISTMHIALTQHIALMTSANIFHSPSSLANMFQLYRLV